MSDEYRQAVIAIATKYYLQGYCKMEAIRKAEADLRLPQFIQYFSRR